MSLWKQGYCHKTGNLKFILFNDDGKPIVGMTAVGGWLKLPDQTIKGRKYTIFRSVSKTPLQRHYLNI